MKSEELLPIKTNPDLNLAQNLTLAAELRDQVTRQHGRVRSGIHG